MKKLILILLLAGCASPPQPQVSLPPLPPKPKQKSQVMMSPKGAEQAKALAIHPSHPAYIKAGPMTKIPTWAFPTVSGSTNGAYAIDGSTDLTTWYPVAVVYSTTNITLVSDTVTKRSKLFYRVRIVD